MATLVSSEASARFGPPKGHPKLEKFSPSKSFGGNRTQTAYFWSLWSLLRQVPVLDPQTPCVLWLFRHLGYTIPCVLWVFRHPGYTIPCVLWVFRQPGYTIPCILWLFRHPGYTILVKYIGCCHCGSKSVVKYVGCYRWGSDDDDVDDNNDNNLDDDKLISRRLRRPQHLYPFWFKRVHCTYGSSSQTNH